MGEGQEAGGLSSVWLAQHLLKMSKESLVLPGQVGLLNDSRSAGVATSAQS